VKDAINGSIRSYNTQPSSKARYAAEFFVLFQSLLVGMPGTAITKCNKGRFDICAEHSAYHVYRGRLVAPGGSGVFESPKLAAEYYSRFIVPTIKNK
jgi:hypothetical protein